MGRKKVWYQAGNWLKHEPSGLEAFYESGEDGSVKGWWTADSYVGSSIREAKKMMKAIADMLKGGR